MPEMKKLQMRTIPGADFQFEHYGNRKSACSGTTICLRSPFTK
jgi:hypothetical protein